jgi:hypothetical protein
MVEKRNEYRILVGKRPLGRPRRRSVDNIKIDLERDRMDDIDLGQGRDQWRAFVNMIMNLQAP